MFKNKTYSPGSFGITLSGLSGGQAEPESRGVPRTSMADINLSEHLFFKEEEIMKSFFKKLSVVVLAAAMVLSVVPAMNATAAGLTIGVTKADAKTAYELNVGEDVDLAFFGATGYVAKTDSTNVEWKSSNTAVATVDKYGVVTAVKAGSTTISCTVKTAANNQTYTGSVTVTVKAAVASLEVTPKKYINGDFTYEIVFPTAEEATAAKAALDVKRVRVANGKRLELYTRVKASSVTANVLTFSFAASNGVTYRYEPKFVKYLDKKRSEGKIYNVAISHAAKKLVSVIWKMKNEATTYR